MGGDMLFLEDLTLLKARLAMNPITIGF